MPLYVEVDEIYNLACPASPVHYQFDPVQTLKTSVHGAINMLGLAKRIKAKIFQASTSEVYGDPLVHPQPESYWGHVNPLGSRACYDEGKRAAETLFFDYHRQHGVRIKIARIFNTYGPRMHPNDGRVVSNFIMQALRGEPITIYGDGTQTRSFGFVDDLIEGVWRMMSADEAILGPDQLRQSQRDQRARARRNGHRHDRLAVTAGVQTAAGRRSEATAAGYFAGTRETELDSQGRIARRPQAHDRLLQIDHLDKLIPMLLSVVIPAYNERHTLGTILRVVARAMPDVSKEIIVVDDCSKDGTREWLKANFPQGARTGSSVDLDAEGDLIFVPESGASTVTVRPIYHERNRGKGGALQTGLAALSGDVFVIQDADLEYDPNDWVQMYDLIAVRKVADVVYGSRFYGRPHRSLYFHHYLANRLISFLFNLVFNQTLTDIETCYKMMTREVARSLRLSANDFGIEVEMSAEIARQRSLRIYELGISYYGRTYAEGKKINWKDGIKALWYIFKFRLR